MDDFEPKRYRIQRWPLPDSGPILMESGRRRLAWLRAMAAVSNSQWSERDREARAEEILDNAELREDNG